MSRSTIDPVCPPDCVRLLRRPTLDRRCTLCKTPRIAHANLTYFLYPRQICNLLLRTSRDMPAWISYLGGFHGYRVSADLLQDVAAAGGLASARHAWCCRPQAGTRRYEIGANCMA